MRVLIITPRYYPNTPGGGARSIHLIAREINKRIDVEVYSQDDAKTITEEVEGVKVTRKHLSSHGKTSMNFRCITDLFGNYELDLIHCYNMDLMPAAGFLTKYNNVKSVATINGTVYSRHSEWYNMYKNSPNLYPKVRGSLFLMRNTLMKSFIKGINQYSVLCPHRREVFVREGLERERFTVIPNILDTSFEPKELVRDDRVRVLYVGSINWLKGLDVLLHAYSLLEKGRIELMVVGITREDAPPHPRAVNPITFMGKLPYSELPDVYARSDIYVNSYRYPEPVSRSVMEAMQTGIPVITTGTPSYSPIVRDGVDGILVYPCTSNKLAEAIQHLIDNPELRETMGEAAKVQVEEVCNPKRIGDLYLKLYEKTLGNE